MHIHQVKPDALILACVVIQVPMFYASRKASTKSGPYNFVWLSVRVLDWRPRGRRFKPHRCHCVVSLNKNIIPSLVLVQARKTCPYITERLLMGCKESNQTNKSIKIVHFCKLPRAILVCVPAFRLLEAMLALRKKKTHPNFVACQQHRCRQSCDCAQPDQHL